MIMSKEKTSKLNTIQNGKGDKPRNISKKFWENYDQIRWDRKKKK
jgi:hypothetical protein